VQPNASSKAPPIDQVRPNATNFARTASCPTGMGMGWRPTGLLGAAAGACARRALSRCTSSVGVSTASSI